MTNAVHATRPRFVSRLALVFALLLCPALGVAGCGDDDAGGGSGSTATAANACESNAFCYEVEGGLDAADQAICVQQGSKVLAACDASKAVRKCTQPTNVAADDEPAKTVNYVYYFREGDTTGCAGKEEKLN